MSKTIVKMEGIYKEFPGVKALNGCQFDLIQGEVHAVVGENGAGKSTLMKVLAGIYHKDSGKIFIRGAEINILTPRIAQNLGISIIHQELNLMPHLTVAQNIFIGREPRKKGLNFILNEKEINKKTNILLQSLNLDLNPETRASYLTIAKQQMVEIAKALSLNSEVLIMDEPTSALTETEIEELFKTMQDLKEKGVGIVYITHRLDELFKICDRVTVMRDGNYIQTTSIKDITKDQIISMMVGRIVYESHAQVPENNSTDVVLQIRNLNRSPDIKNVTFELKKGEILGFAGLMGAGRTEVARAIFGADPFDSGEIYINGRKVAIKSPRDAVRNGIGYLSEDRKRFGLALGMSVEINTVLASLKSFTKVLGIVNSKKTFKIAEYYVEALNIKTPGIKQPVKYLSGGNQQKVIIGKWLTENCNIFIFDEPTRGIDIGAKAKYINF